MKKTRFFKIPSLLLCMVLIAAMALTAVGCNGNDTSSEPSLPSVSSETATVMGEGETQFNFTVTDANGNATLFEIHTNKKTVGEALTELKLIDGEAGTYGLYVKTVNGIKLDYDTDKMYWAFYENGKYASAGVDKTEIKPGTTYEFKAEK